MPASPRWCPSCRRGAADAAPTLLVVGALADVVEDQLRRLFGAMGIDAVRVPAAAPRRRRCRRSGPTRAFLLAQPFLADTARALEDARRDAPRRAVPARRRGHDAVAARRRRRLGRRAPRGSRRSPSWRRSAPAAPSRRHRARLAGKRVFLFPDSQLEIPLARFLSRELAMQLVEVGTPYLHRAASRRRAGAAAGRHAAQRGPGRRPAARPLPRGAARSRGVRPRPRQSAGGRGHRHEMVDRAGVHADPGLRAGRRPRRAVRAPAGAARRGWRCSAMQLTLWTYEGPPHVGAMRVATAMEGVHYVLHAPQGDTYADLLFTMIERRGKRPPVTYTTFQARDLGGDTAELFKTAAREAYERFRPQAMLVGASCTAELIQDDPGGLARALDLPIPVVARRAAGLSAQGELGRGGDLLPARRAPSRGPGSARAARPGGAAALQHAGPDRARLPPPRRRARDDARCWSGSASTSTSPRRWAPRPADLARLGDADFNVVLYPEIAGPTAAWLQRSFGQPATRTIPIGVGATREFIAEVGGAGRRRCGAAAGRVRAVAAALVLALGRTPPISPASACSCSATPPTPSPRRASPATNSASPSSASAATAASSAARCARRPSCTASRR